MSGKRFRIAFSFAGEKRDFVAAVAGMLAGRFGEAAVLYDKYHEAQFARARLGRFVPKLYHEESDLVVVTICRDYLKKEFCGLEWDERRSGCPAGRGQLHPRTGHPLRLDHVTR